MACTPPRKIVRLHIRLYEGHFRPFKVDCDTQIRPSLQQFALQLEFLGWKLESRRVWDGSFLHPALPTGQNPAIVLTQGTLRLAVCQVRRTYSPHTYHNYILTLVHLIGTCTIWHQIISLTGLPKENNLCSCFRQVLIPSHLHAMNLHCRRLRVVSKVCEIGTSHVPQLASLTLQLSYI